MEQGSKEWHAHRATGIGGSDAAAALGLSKWKTPYQLFLEKTGKAEPHDETWEMARGKALEPLLRQHYADVTGRVVHLPKDAMRSKQYPFMLYNPDGVSLEDRRLQEFKTAAYGDGWGQEGSDEIPQEYLLQVQHGMIVSGFDVTDVTVSIAGNLPKFFEVHADKALQAMIIEQEHEFWHKYVTTLIAPPPTSNEDVAALHSWVNGESIEATPQIIAVLERLHDIRANIKNLEADKEACEVEIKDFMGPNEVLMNDGIKLATWKQQAGSRRLDSDALRKDQPAIAEAYTKVGDPLRRFLLK